MLHHLAVVISVVKYNSTGSSRLNIRKSSVPISQKIRSLTPDEDLT